MKCYLFSLQSIFAAACLLATFADAAEKLQADLIPLGLRARNDALIPVEARFKWDATRILEGRLELEFREGNRVLGRYRTDDLALTTGEQRFRLLLPALLQPISDPQVEVRMRFVATNEVLDLDSSSLSLPTADERSLGLGWCNPRNDSAPRALDLEQSLLLERFDPVSVSSAQRKLLTSMSRLAPEDLPMQPLAYTAFDVMVLTAEGFAEAREGQLQTLARWVKGGGSVCVFVGGGLQSHQLAFLNELVDTNSAGPLFMADSSGNLLPGLNKISCFRSGVGRSVIVTGNIQPDPGLDSVEWRGAVAFLWKLRENQRQAILATGRWEAATNFNALAAFPTQPYPGRGFRGPRPPPMPVVRPMSYGVQPTSFGSELMTQLMPKTVRLIPFSAMVGMLGVFVLMIGPMDYFLLGWLRQRRYTWVLFPAVSIAFTMATVLMANHYLGLRDQRRSLIVVDVDKDGTPVRWNQFELVFAARDKQAVTELKDALWAQLNADVASELGQMAAYGPRYYNQRTPNFNARLYYQGQPSPLAEPGDEGVPPWFEGTVPAHFRTSKPLRQWRPELNRVFSFESPPAPVLANWSAIEGAWPNLEEIRAKLSAKKPFDGDVCAISSADQPRSYPGTARAQGSANNFNNVSVQYLWVDGQTEGPPCQIVRDGGSQEIVPDWILAKLCLGEQSSGLLSIVSQISPTGGGNFEDVPVMDKTDSALAIVTRMGDDIVVYRRIFHGN